MSPGFAKDMNREYSFYTSNKYIGSHKLQSYNVTLYDRIIDGRMDRHRPYPRPWYQGEKPKPKPKKIKKVKLVPEPIPVTDKGCDPCFGNNRSVEVECQAETSFMLENQT